MNFQSTLFTWFAVLFLNTFAFAQLTNRIEWTSDTDLLPQNSVKSIVQDKFGYLWLSTENGLVRFDGQNYKIYNSQNIDLKSNRILSIQGDLRSDSLYVATDRLEDLILIHGRIAKKVPRSLPPAQVYLDEAARAYNAFGSTTYSIDLTNWSYKILLPSHRYYIVTKSHVRYFSTEHKLLKEVPLLNPNTKYFFTLGEQLFYLKDEKNYAVFTDGQVAWSRLDFKLLPNYKIIWNKVCNQLFLQSGKQLLLVRNQNGTLASRHMFTDPQLIYTNVMSAFYDSIRDIVFLGSSTSGLGTYRFRNFKTLSVIDDKQSAVFYASTPLTNQTLLTSSGFEMNKDTILHSHRFINEERTTMQLDKHENVWLKSSNELYYYGKNTNYKTAKTYVFSNKIGTFYQDASERIWMTLESGNAEKSKLLFFRSSEHAVFRHYMSFDFRVNYMRESTDGKLWLASSKGLYLLDQQRHILKHIEGTASLNIRSILQTKADEIWIATYGKGFFLYKNNKLHSFPQDKNDYLATAHYFMEDRNGFFWIPTNKGLFQVKKSALLSYADDPTQSIYYHYYNKESGFLTNEFNGGGSPYSTQLGTRFFMPSMNGMVTFDTEKIRPLEPKNPIHVDEIKVDGRLLAVTNALHLPNDYQRVTFSFSSPYYGNELNSNYEVKLEGPTQLDWTALNNEYNYTLTKLAPGSYTLLVRKLSGFDSTYIYKKITFHVAPAFYQTHWFLLLVILAVLLLTYCFSKMYSNNVRRRNKLLIHKIKESTSDLQNTISTLRATKDNMKAQADRNNKLIQIISHDIKSPLKFMSMASKYMYDDFDPNSPDLKENILSLHTSSSQIYNFLDNVLSYSKVNTEDGALTNERFLLYPEIQEKITLFKNIATSQKTKLINAIPQTLSLNTNKSLFAIIIHNLLDNAVKHTSNGSVELTAEQKGDLITITITDDGTGMDAETLAYYQSVIEDFDLHKVKSQRKLGLHLVIELLLILNGKIELKSVMGKGTTVTLVFDHQIEKESS